MKKFVIGLLVLTFLCVFTTGLQAWEPNYGSGDPCDISNQFGWYTWECYEYILAENGWLPNVYQWWE